MDKLLIICVASFQMFLMLLAGFSALVLSAVLYRIVDKKGFMIVMKIFKS